MKIALITLALLGSLWTTRALSGGGSRPWSDSDVHATFFEDGSPRSQATLRDGRLHGPARTWHRGDRPASQGEYVDDLRQGPWRYWRPDGSLDESRSGVYERGERVAPLDAHPRPSSSKV
jgi:antitoxin component YwqK of YwqJK toxin-antitoxin module